MEEGGCGKRGGSPCGRRGSATAQRPTPSCRQHGKGGRQGIVRDEVGAETSLRWPVREGVCARALYGKPCRPSLGERGGVGSVGGGGVGWGGGWSGIDVICLYNHTAIHAKVTIISSFNQCI